VKVIDELRHKYKLADLLAFAELPRSTFYYQLKRMKSPDKNQEIKDVIRQIYHENKGRYGYRRITLELKNRGYIINHKKVQRLMQIIGIKCLIRRAKYRSYKGEVGVVAPNILKRDFRTDKPNKKWVTDVTEFSIPAGKLYLSPILDLYNGEIVSFNVSKRPTFHQTMDMLDKAFSKIPNGTNLIFHSDQGWQYQMKPYQYRLQEKGIRQSMSRKGNCLDNSVMENFFGILKSEMFYGSEFKFKTLDELNEEIVEYINYYNNKRIKSNLKGLSPVQYRTQSLEVA